MKITLYDEGTAENLNIEEISQYLGQKTGNIGIEVSGSPFARLSEVAIADFARMAASTRIPDINKEIEPDQVPLYGEIEYERRKILGKTSSFGIVYDGFHLQRLFLDTIPPEARRRELAHVIFTNRLFATWDEGNHRYHLRTSVYSNPSLISTTGLVEAPARPREYYLLKHQLDKLGRDLAELKDKFKGNFLEYADTRLTEVVKGYVMQAIFYFLTGDPFCEDRGCRLYNAHWQEELIFAQLESSYEFCPRHTRFLESEFPAGERNN